MEQYIPLKEGYKVFTKNVGEGDIKLLTIPGGPGLTHECFANFPEHLNPEGIQVIFYDPLGSFHSDQPADPALWNMPRFVDELHQVVKALNLENQFVLANSWGSMLLIEYLLKYQTPFKGVILTGMCASFGKFKENIIRRRSQLPKSVLEMLKVYEDADNIAAPEYQQLLFLEWFNRHYCTLNPWPGPLLNSLQKLAVPVMHSMLGLSPFSYTGPDTKWDRKDDLEKIEVPVLLLTGKEDIVFEGDLKLMASKMRNTEYHICQKGGHFCWWEDETAFFDQVSQFILGQK